MTKRQTKTTARAPKRRTAIHVRLADAKRQAVVEAALILLDTTTGNLRLVAEFWERVQADRRLLVEVCIARGIPIPKGLMPPPDDADLAIADVTPPEAAAWHGFDYQTTATLLSRMPAAARALWIERFSNEMRRRIAG